MGIRAYMDNVILKLDPLEAVSGGGIVMIDQTRLSGHRFATVVSSGPGHYRKRLERGPGTVVNKAGDQYHTVDSHMFIPNETKPGDRVIIGKHAGTDFRLDLSVPRHNKGQHFEELLGDRGEFRIVREEEIEGIVEDESVAEAAE